jgi:hypothetical protein
MPIDPSFLNMSKEGSIPLSSQSSTKGFIYFINLHVQLKKIGLPFKKIDGCHYNKENKIPLQIHLIQRKEQY